MLDCPVLLSNNISVQFPYICKNHLKVIASYPAAPPPCPPPLLAALSLVSLMGNAAASCAPSIITNGVVKVVFSSTGHLEIYTKPVKAAELMLQNPGEFVCDSSSLKVGHRIHGLSADEGLERRQLYFLLPMELLYSVLTHEEMSTLTRKATKALKHNNNFGKIFPVLSEFCIFPSEARSAMPDHAASTSHGQEAQEEEAEEGDERYSKQRSWRPALETIVES